MNRISQRIEDIFSHAVGMEQNGKMRNTIYCLEDQIFILNSDHSVLLKFQIRKSETGFAHPVSFRANDYDSREFYEKDGKIVFHSESDGFKREKSCLTPGDTPEDIAKLFESFPLIRTNSVKLHKSILSHLDDNLSHIEISAPDKKLQLIQQNIYSGSVIKLTRSEEGLGLDQQDSITEEFGPIGLRTIDFKAMFSFIDKVEFFFPEGEIGYCRVRSNDPKMAMEGYIGRCDYDELGVITESKKENQDGRKKQESGSRKQSADRSTEEPTTQRRRRSAA